MLFRSVLPKRLSAGYDYAHDVFGPTYQYVDFQTAWPWTRPGGDWIDANQVRHGALPWFSAPVVGVGATLVRSYSVDATAAVTHCYSARRWCAFLLTSANAPRTVAGNFHPQQAAPTIDVIYRNGQRATLRCRVMASNTSSSYGPITTAAQHSLPAFVEFEQPTPPLPPMHPPVRGPQFQIQ